MKKTALVALCALMIGCFGGLLLNLTVFHSRGVLPPAPDPAVTLPVSQGQMLDPLDNAPLLEAGNRVLKALKDRDYGALSLLAHPDLGITFTPYSTVDPDRDIVLTAELLAQAGKDTTRYTWGVSHGSGDPIYLTVSEYIDTYVFNADYTQAPLLGVDRVISSGNSLENVADAYPDCRFVEYYFPGLSPANEGLDWCALKLVFQDCDGAYRLVGVIHSQWTI